MRAFLFQLPPESKEPLQLQLRRAVIEAIRDDRLRPGDRMPSVRILAERLGIARNTVVLAYRTLVGQGYLERRDRSGHFVAADRPGERSSRPKITRRPRDVVPDWPARLAIRASGLLRLGPPRGWQSYPYPFVYGQVDPKLFPLAEWRECSRQALGRRPVDEWAPDSGGEDDPHLVDQLRRNVLPARGIAAAPEEILVTVGAQHALFLIAQLLFLESTVVGVEEPGYSDARTIFALRTRRLKPLPVDDEGLVVDRGLDRCEYVYVTPSHQAPTTVTMSEARRIALLERAAARDVVVIEDDYERDTSLFESPIPSLRALDRSSRVIYVGSFSRALGPGLRVGYIVAPVRVASELRLLRHVVLRHPPNNNQRTLALFIENGHLDALLARVRRVYRRRWEIAGAAIDRHLPGFRRKPNFGGAAYWLEGPRNLDTATLAADALKRGVIVDPGAPRFLAPDPPRHYMRVGFGAIEESRIEPGLRILGEVLRRRRPRAAVS